MGPGRVEADSVECRPGRAVADGGARESQGRGQRSSAEHCREQRANCRLDLKQQCYITGLADQSSARSVQKR